MKEVVVNSWRNRLVGALAGSLVGLALIIGSFYLIFWNEGHGLHLALALRETGQKLVSVAIAPIDSKNNLRPVYFSGLATTSEVLRDPLLDVSQQAIILRRTVEIYQWQEQVETKKESEVGGSEVETKVYTYSPVWSEALINSDTFKEPETHRNPKGLLFQSRVLQAKIVKVGDFSLPPDFVSKMKGETILDLSRLDLTSLQKKLNKPVQHLDYGLYAGQNPQEPVVGDMKVTVSEILPQTVSVIAQERGKTVAPYLAHSGQAVGLLVMGTQSPEEMIQQAETENRILTWIFRGLSLLLMCLGLALILRPLVILADVIPFLGDLMGVGTGLLAFAGGAVLWSLGTAIAWFAVRPLWSLGLLALILIFGYIIVTHRD